MSDFKKVFAKNTYVEEAKKVSFEEFDKVVSSRRSVRRYTDAKIPDEVVKKCLEHALLAPNSSNLQPWEFYWIKSADVRKSIDVAFLSQPAVTTAATVIVAVARTSTWRKNARRMAELIRKEDPSHSALPYYEKIVPFVYSLGLFNIFGWFKKFIFMCNGFFKPVPREPANLSELRTWAVKSTALACQNLMLSFRAAGYDSCPMEGMDSSRVKKILGLPRDAVVVMGISAGQRAPNGVFGPRVRFEENEFIHTV